MKRSNRIKSREINKIKRTVKEVEKKRKKLRELIEERNRLETLGPKISEHRVAEWKILTEKIKRLEEELGMRGSTK